MMTRILVTILEDKNNIPPEAGRPVVAIDAIHLTHVEVPRHGAFCVARSLRRSFSRGVLVLHPRNHLPLLIAVRVGKPSLDCYQAMYG
jgi:hypothetical protein